MNNDNLEKQRVKNALCYVPIVAFVLHFIEKDKSEDLQRNIYYGMIFFWTYFILNLIVNWFFISLVMLVYVWWSLAFWYKAYVWEDIRISFIDEQIKKHKK